VRHLGRTRRVLQFSAGFYVSITSETGFSACRCHWLSRKVAKQQLKCKKTCIFSIFSYKKVGDSAIFVCQVSHKWAFQPVVCFMSEAQCLPSV
jgi:hypothetical protein